MNISTAWEITPIGLPNAEAKVVKIDGPAFVIPATTPGLDVRYGKPTVSDGYVDIPVTIRNKGNVPLTVDSVTLAPGDSSEVHVRHAVDGDGIVRIPEAGFVGFSGKTRVHAGADTLVVKVSGDKAELVTEETKSDDALNIAAIVLGTIGALTGLLALCQQVLNFLHR